MSTWLITGCSTGLGRALAEAVIAAGHNAVVTARDVGKVADLAVDNTGRVLALPLDVTDTAQVANAVGTAKEKFGGIGVLVNNAGYGYRAAVEEGDDSDIRALFETQFFGAVAMIKAVLPGMRGRRSGAIVNISTIGVQIMPAGSGYYAASKAALEGMSGALYGELKPLGISVTIVEPGAFRTDFAGRSLTQSSTVIDDYAETAGKRRKEHDRAHGTQPGDPGKAAEAIIAAVESDEPPHVPAAWQGCTQHLPPARRSQTRHHRHLGSTSPQVPISTPELGGLGRLVTAPRAGAVPRCLTLYTACTPSTACASHVAWDVSAPASVGWPEPDRSAREPSRPSNPDRSRQEEGLTASSCAVTGRYWCAVLGSGQPAFESSPPE